MEDIIIRYLHFISIMVLISALVAEHLLVAKEVPLATFRKLVVIDQLYGIAAVVILATGLTLWFGVGKPASFYSSNMVFYIKICLFVVAGLISLFPTIFIIRHRKTDASVVVMPSYIINAIRVQLVVLLVIPLLAVTMARGYGMIS